MIFSHFGNLTQKEYKAIAKYKRITNNKIHKIVIANHVILFMLRLNFRKSRDGGDRTPGYGSEDRRVAITPHP